MLGVDWILNIAYMESPLHIEAKTCGCKENGITIAYSFIDSYHSLCLDRKDIMLWQLDACERLLKYTTDEMDRSAIIKEIAEIKMTGFLPSESSLLIGRIPVPWVFDL